MPTLTRTASALLLLPLALAACGGREDALADQQRVRVTTAEDLQGGRPADAEAPATPGDGAPAAPGAEPGIAAGPAAPGDAPAAPGGAAQPAGQPAAPAPGAGAQPQPAAAPGDQAAQDRAAEILRRVERTSNGIRALEADFTQSLSVPLLNTSQRSSGKLYQRKPDRFLMKFSDPEGDVIVADGRYFWLYYPSNDRTQVVRTSIAAGSERADFQREFVSNPTERYVATLMGEETVGGQETYVLSLVPRRASPYKLLKVWIDKDDNLIRRFEMTEENETVRRVELRNIRVNPTLPDALFTFTPPPGAQVFTQ